MSKARDLSKLDITDAISVTVNNTATVAQMSTDANNALLVENTNAAGVSGLRMRGGSGKAAIMYGENNSTDEFSIIPRNDTSKAFTIDSVGNVVVAGNLQIEGSQTVLNTSTLSVEDLNITVASGAANAAAANGAGLTVAGAAATLLYTATGDKWAFNKPLDVTGSVTSSGVLTANAGVVVDNITIDGQEIDLSSGDLTLDVAGNINLDADGGEFRFKDGGTLYATAYQGGGGSFYLASAVQDKDLIFQGNDGGTTITALTLDMSAAGNATFSGNVTTGASLISTNAIVDSLAVKTSTGSMLVKTSAGANIARFNNILTTDLFGSLDVTGSITASGTVDVAGNITVGNNNTIFAENNIRFKATGASYIDIQAIDQDLIFRTSETTALDTNALRLDGSAGGFATFNDGISAKRHLVQAGGEIEFDFNGFGEHFTGGSSPHIFAGQGSTTTYLAGTLNFQSRQTVARDINFITGTTPAVALNIDGATGAATFRSSITIPDYVIHDGNTATKFGFGSANTMNFISNGSDRLTIANSYAVFNEAGTDYDFRVESDNNTHMLFVDGGNDRVGIGRVPTISNSKLEVGGADNVSLINVEASGVTGGMGIGSTGLQFFHGSSSKLAIASSGAASFNSNVGIGCTPSAWAFSKALQLGDGSSLATGGNQNMWLSANLYLASDANFKYITNNKASQINLYNGGVIFHRVASGTAGATATLQESGRFDDSGNFLVGKTTTNIATSGCRLGSFGAILTRGDGSEPLRVNRTSSNGEIIRLDKDGTSVGIIGVEGNDALYIESGTTSGSGLHFHPTAGVVRPARNGSTIDNAIDLGTANRRFVDLHLSGGIQSAGGSTFTDATPLSFNKAGTDVYTKTVLYDAQNDIANGVFSGLTLEMGRLTNSSSATPRTFTISDRGATNRWCFSQYGLSFNPTSSVATAAESLNDYEEGTWSPVIGGDGANSGTQTYTGTYYGKYIKIGRLVTLYFDLQVTALGTTTGTYAVIKGFPFNVQQSHIGGGTFNYYSSLTGITEPLNCYVGSNEIGYLMRGGASYVPRTALTANTRLMGQVSYYTNE